MEISDTNVPATEGMKHHDLGGNILEAPLQSHLSFALFVLLLATSCYQKDIYKYIFFLKGGFLGFAEERQFLRVRRIKNKKNRHLERFFKKKKLNEVGR